MTDNDKRVDNIIKEALKEIEENEESLEEQLAKVPAENPVSQEDESEDEFYDDGDFDEQNFVIDSVDDDFIEYKEENSHEADEEDFEEHELEADEADEEDFEEHELEADEADEEDFEEHEFETDEEDEGEESGGKKRGKKALIVFGCIIILLVAVYFGVAMFFNSHFLYGTKINGTDFSLKNVEQVEAYMKEQVQDYTLTLEESDGTEEVIQGSDISIEYVPGEELKQLVKGQQKLFWIKCLWEPSEITAKVGVKYDENKLVEVLNSLDCMDEEKQIASKNAYPAFKDTKFEIVPEVVGTKLDEEKFTAVVSEAISSFQNRVNLVDTDCYILPQYVSDSEEVIEATEKMNSYLGAQITYDFGSEKEVVDSSVIAEWLKVSKKKMKVSFDKEAVQKYIQELAAKYDTKYKAKEFTTATGDTVTVEGGSYGWQIDQEAEYDQLLKDIKKGKAVNREPEYASRAASRDGAGVGSTYAEVDLTKQHMYFIKDGKVVLETDVVTGNPNKGNATPQGIYTLSYKTKDATLRGQRRPDGTYEYETPVKYWMPFNGGIGFHDATWQPTFGGERYKTNGSHGCVNMPKEKAGELYELISAGTPVVCHY
ncbi:MAG: L,D-transpeptidase family protein [Lachnospiraceae bacterium]